MDDTKEHRRVLDLALKLIAYLPCGDALEVGGITYTKLDEDTVHVLAEAQMEEALDAAVRARVIRVPT